MQLRRLFLALPPLVLLCQSANAIPLQFNSPVTNVDGTSIYGAVARSTVIDFLDVGTQDGATVDLRITATRKAQTVFGRTEPRGADEGDPGFIPSYGGTAAEPNNDLSLLYYGRRVNGRENGLLLTFDFFDGTGALSGTFAQSLALAEIDLVLYDIDGETITGPNASSQSEGVTAFLADGLVAYALGQVASPLTASLDTSALQLSGHSNDVGQNDVAGAVRLLFRDTASFTLDLGSQMFSGPDVNPVFAGIDGDMSLFSAGDFGTLVSVLPDDPALVVPLPAGIVLLMTSGGVLFLSRRRSERRTRHRDAPVPTA